MLTVVPSRGRPAAIGELLTLIDETRGGATDLLIAVDHDDPTLPAYQALTLPWWASLTVITPRLRLLPTLNLVASTVDGYEALGFMGDDHRPRTPGWDVYLAGALRANPGVAYGNDLLQGAALATAAWLSYDIIRVLGFMAPPALTHLYADNFWLDLGHETSLTYLDDVIIEHMHPSVGKGTWDDGYHEVNSAQMDTADRLAYVNFMRDEWPTAKGSLTPWRRLL